MQITERTYLAVVHNEDEFDEALGLVMERIAGTKTSRTAIREYHLINLDGAVPYDGFKTLSRPIRDTRRDAQDRRLDMVRRMLPRPWSAYFDKPDTLIVFR